MKRVVRTNSRHISGEDTDLEQQVQENTDNIATKQDQITESTDLDMNILTIGGENTTPGTTVVPKLFIDTSYDSIQVGGTNGTGNSIQFRFPNGFNSATAGNMGNIECYFASGSGTAQQYSGIRMTSRDDNTQQTLIDCYHQPPNSDGRSVMEVGGSGGDGLVKARNYLRTEIINNDIGGYLFAIISSLGTTDVNTSTPVAADWTEIYMDTDNFSRPSTSEVRILTTGVYEISFNVFLVSSNTRVNPWVRLVVDGNDTGYGSLSYIRNLDNHNVSCWVMSPILYTISANQDLTIEASDEGLGGTGSTYYFFSGSPLIHSHLMIKRIV